MAKLAHLACGHHFCVEHRIPNSNVVWLFYAGQITKACTINPHSVYTRRYFYSMLSKGQHLKWYLPLSRGAVLMVKASVVLHNITAMCIELSIKALPMSTASFISACCTGLLANTTCELRSNSPIQYQPHFCHYFRHVWMEMWPQFPNALVQ